MQFRARGPRSSITLLAPFLLCLSSFGAMQACASTPAGSADASFTPPDASVVDSATSDTAIDDDPRALPCAVESALQENCRVCHKNPPREGVPFPLVTYADTQRETNLTVDGGPAPIWTVIGEVLREGRMPVSTTTFVPDPLPESSPARQALLDWVDAGAPPREDGAVCP